MISYTASYCALVRPSSYAILSLRNSASLRAALYVIALAEMAIVIIIAMSIIFFIIVYFYLVCKSLLFLFIGKGSAKRMPMKRIVPKER